MRLIPVSARREWEAAVARVPHSIFHSWSFSAAIEGAIKCPVFLYCDETNSGSVVCPLACRTFHGHPDLVTPYGIGGFATSPSVRTDFMDRWQEYCRHRGYVCAYVAQEPLLVPRDLTTHPLVSAADTLYYLDLRKRSEEILAGLSHGRRSDVRRFSRSRLETDQAILADSLAEGLPSFLSSKGVSFPSVLPASTIAAVGRMDQVMLLGSRSRTGFSAICAFGFSPFVADWLFAMSTGEGRGDIPGLVWEAVMRLQGLEVPWLCMGGGVRSNPGIGKSKELWRPVKREMLKVKAVFNREVFDTLTTRTGVSDSGYFPPYRSPELHGDIGTR